MARPQSCAVAHASIATTAGSCLAREPSNCARDTFLRNTAGRPSPPPGTWKTRFAKSIPMIVAFSMDPFSACDWSCNIASLRTSMPSGIHPIKNRLSVKWTQIQKTGSAELHWEDCGPRPSGMRDRSNPCVPSRRRTHGDYRFSLCGRDASRDCFEEMTVSQDRTSLTSPRGSWRPWSNCRRNRIKQRPSHKRQRGRRNGVVAKGSGRRLAIKPLAAIRRSAAR